MKKSYLYLGVEEIKSIEPLTRVELPELNTELSNVQLIFVRLEGEKTTEFPAIAIFKEGSDDIDQLIDIKHALHYRLHMLEPSPRTVNDDDYGFTDALPYDVK